MERAKKIYKFEKKIRSNRESILIGIILGFLLAIEISSIAVKSSKGCDIPMDTSKEAFELSKETEIPIIEERESLGHLIIIDVEPDTISEELNEEPTIENTEEEMQYSKSIDQNVFDYFYIAGNKNNIPGEILQAIAKRESNYDPLAVSESNDHGLMQLNECNFDYLESVGITDVYNPYMSIDGACYLINNIRKEVKTDDWNLILMSYNMGVTGARRLYESGVTSSNYSRDVLRIAESMKGE